MSDPFPPPGDHPPPGGQPPPPPPGYGYQQQGYGYSQAPGFAFSGFWRRVGAVVIDAFVIGIPLNILIVGLGLDTASAFIVRLVAAAVYYSLLEGGPKGQTVGKLAVGVRVVDDTTYQPGIGPGRACGRHFAKFLSGLALGLGYLWMLWDPRKQCWHDKLARTVVVRA